MIFKEAVLLVPDNSNVLFVKLIKVLKNKKQHGKIGDNIIVSVNTIRKEEEKKIKKGDVLKGIIIQTRKRYSRIDKGYFINFNRNCAVLFNKNNNKLIGNRIQVALPKELRNKKRMKLLSIAPCIV
jgi:large subunit ribosomal protein L14